MSAKPSPEISFFSRLWNALKPPSAESRWHPTPAQKRLLTLTGIALVVLGLTGGVWAYIASAPQRAQNQFEQGVRLMTPNSYGDAVKRFDRAIDIWPQFAQAYYERGVAHKFLGDVDAAAGDFSRAIAADPQLGAAYTERAEILRVRGDLNGALQDFTRAVEASPTANSFYQRGETFALLGQPEKALEDFDRAIAESPDAPYVYRARAEVKRSLGDMAGYKADHDLAVRTEYRDVPPAWVDQPLPGDTGAGNQTAVKGNAVKPAATKNTPAKQ